MSGSLEGEKLFEWRSIMEGIANIFLFVSFILLIMFFALRIGIRNEEQIKLSHKIGLYLLGCISVSMILFSCSSAHAEGIIPPISETFVTPMPTRADYILARVKHADKLCDEQNLSFITEEGKTTHTIEEKDKKGKLLKRKVVSRVNKIVARPVYLCAFKESDQTWHVVKVFVKYPIPKTYLKFPAWVATEGYEITYVRGQGVTRLTFNLSQNGEHLTVYRYRHSWFTKVPKSHTAHEVIRTARAINYTPYHSDFNDLELRNMGANFLQSELNAAFSELEVARVISRAFPSKLVSAVIHPKQPMILAAIEQTDDGRFLANSLEAINAVFIEYGLNHGRAFSWSVSNADALGALQFTNKNGNGTYDFVVRAYPKANLNPDFEEGTRDLRNVLKAAICLLDYELANLPAVRELYEQNPRIGGIYPVAAYNEGGGGARQLYSLITKNNVDLEQEDVELPQTVFQRIRKALTFTKKKKHTPMKKVFNHETYGYVKKYLYVWEYLDTLPPLIVVAK